MGVIWIVATIVFFTDFFVKNYLHFNFPYQSIPVIKNIFHITVVFNKGAAFGILKGQTSLLIYAGLIFILIFLIFVKNEKKKNLLFLIPCGLILGGAVSNLTDRFFFGYVIDYLDIRVWPVFNLSDFCITIGAGLLLLTSFNKTDYG